MTLPPRSPDPRLAPQSGIDDDQGILFVLLAEEDLEELYSDGLLTPDEDAETDGDEA